MFSKASIAVVTALSLALGLLYYTNQTAQLKHEDEKGLIQDAAVEAIGRSIDVRTEFKKKVDDWKLVCGSLIEMDGAALRSGQIAGEPELESDKFCALINSFGRTTLVEFDYGSTDMPAVDWIEKHDIPFEILVSEQ